MSIRIIQRRLSQGQPVDWKRVHRHFSIADPKLNVTVERVKQAVIDSIVDEAQEGLTT